MLTLRPFVQLEHQGEVALQIGRQWFKACRGKEWVSSGVSGPAKNGVSDTHCPENVPGTEWPWL